MAIIRLHGTKFDKNVFRDDTQLKQRMLVDDSKRVHGINYTANRVQFTVGENDRQVEALKLNK